MPQQHSRGGDDDAGPPDETKTYHTEGEQEEKASENVVGPRDSFDHLNDVKSSLIDEGESVSQKSSSSQRNKRLSSGYGDHSKEDRHKKLHSVINDGSKIDHIARFPPYGSLAFIANPGYHNGSMVGGPGIAPKCGVPNVFPSPLRLGEGQKMPVLHPAGAYPPSLAHLMMYQHQQEHYSPGTPPPHVRGLEVDSKTGILRRSHSEISPYHPLSPSALGSHHLEVYNMPWQGQPFYPLTSSALRSPYPPSLAASPASMARLGPSPISSGPVPMGLSHSLMHPMGSSQQHDAQQQNNDRHQKEKEKKGGSGGEGSKASKQQHIKKPLNAFMLYMKEMRASVVKECTLKESAAINQILGRRWHALSREEQAKYYELARKERQLHMQLYPGWSARDNYAIHGKKKKKKRDKTHGENPGEPSTPKKCRARFGVDQQDFWCKPCRRKKKCIRYISSDENDQGKGDDDDDDMDDDQSDTSPCQPPPLNPDSDHPGPPPLSLSSIPSQSLPPRGPSHDAISPKQNGIHSRLIPHPGASPSTSHSNGSQSNGDPPSSRKEPILSLSSSTPSSSMMLPHSSTSSLHKMPSHRDTLPGAGGSHGGHSSRGKPETETSRPLFSPHLHTSSSSNSATVASVSSTSSLSSFSHSSLSIPSLSSPHISHHSQQPLSAQTSPTIVHLPHPAAASYPPLSSTAPPMVMFSPQAPLLGPHPTPSSMHEAFRPHLANGFASAHGLLPMHHQGMPPPPLLSAAHSQQLRVPLSEMPQDLSVKSGTVTA